MNSLSPTSTSPPGFLYLAPMEGVVDWVMRDLLTALGGIDRCVTEFVRVTDELVPKKILYRYCPELKNSSCTRAGTPVFVQFLGGNTDWLAENAAQAVTMGAYGIDLNFGCPAKNVNRHDGGACLLQSPERIFKILSAVRAAVPKPMEVTAKIRLGYDRPEICIENAQAVEAAGIELLTVHCRTKNDMYKPPAFWKWIPKIKEKTKLRIVANGDIFSREDYLRCREVTGCEDFMLGRGALANPLIFRQIKGEAQLTNWSTLHAFLIQFYDASVAHRNENYALCRTKQWLQQMSRGSAAGATAFQNLKTITSPDEFRTRLGIRS